MAWLAGFLISDPPAPRCPFQGSVHEDTNRLTDRQRSRVPLPCARGRPAAGPARADCGRRRRTSAARFVADGQAGAADAMTSAVSNNDGLDAQPSGRRSEDELARIDHLTGTALADAITPETGRQGFT